ncbi:MAG: non-ribosomal peptide synthetase, partial [Chloroflexota bacterium]
ELNQQSDQIAAELQSYGVGPGRFVGIYAERSVRMLVGILGILKAGGAYVPIDPDYPVERIAYIVQDAQLSLILSSTINSIKGEGPLNDLTGVTLLDIETAVTTDVSATGRRIPDAAHRSPDQLAYLIYTSGSTGEPKGVMVNHANIVHSTTAREIFYPESVGRFLLLSSFAFDSSLVGIFWTLATGGSLVLPEPGRHQDVLYLAELISREQVSHLLALPLLYQLMLNESVDNPTALASLRAVIVAGEACHADLIQTHYKRYPDCLLYNEYGPTEGTVWSHAYLFPQDFAELAVPIGKPIPRVTNLVLDRYGRPVPIGVPGELVIGGAGITPGYLNRPELTADKFVSLSDLSRENGAERYYRTGDLVRWLPDGNLVFVGRADHQVKVRGFRIELGEIEAVLVSHPAISAAVVGVSADEGPNKRLIAWYVADAAFEKSGLRQTVLDRLPSYMVPADFVHLTQMPLTPNGKIDRKALPLPSGPAVDLESRELPTTPTEETLASIWAEVLKLPRVGVNANFFDLGGDSIISIQIIAKAKRAGLDLTPQHLFEHQTVAELARHLPDFDEADDDDFDEADDEADDDAFDLVDLDDDDLGQLADLLG